MGSENTACHLLAGGIGGTVGAVITCPLEVVKTRLQSSVFTFHSPLPVAKLAFVPTSQSVVAANYSTVCGTGYTDSLCRTQAGSRTTTSLASCIRHIVSTEGSRALFKGLGPNLVGVAPSRAIYFCSYARAKRYLNTVITPETPLVHIGSAACAGFTASTATNPIWFIKTRLQLDQKRHGSLTISRCIRQVYHQYGLAGFYKGITASYYGIAETVIHFVIYEAIKARLREMKGQRINSQDRVAFDFIEFMAAGACSKTIATCVAYPHEVARTRLRQEGQKYRGFWQTLATVGREEGPRGLYRGLCTQLVRQIPNTAIMMATYEAVIYLCNKPGYT